MKDLARVKPVALVALLFAVTAELLRANGPLLDAVAGDIGILPAAAVAIGLFALPGTLLVTLRRASLPAVVLLLLLVRITAQFAPNVAIVGAGAVLGMVALALAVQRAVDPVLAGTGLLVGGVFDSAIRSLTITWDPIWMDILGIPMVVLVALALWLSLAVRAPESDVLGRSWSIGVYLAVWTTTVGNPAFVASQSGVPVQICLLVATGVLVVGAEVVHRVALHAVAGVVAALGTVGGVALAWWSVGELSLAGALLAMLSGTVCVTRAVASPSRRGNTLLGLAWVLPVLLFQLHYEMPLPFDNRLLPLAAAVVLGLAGLGARAIPEADKPAPEALPPGVWQVNRRFSGLVQPITVAVALALLVPVGVMSINPQRAHASSPGGWRLLSWNVKYGRDDASGKVNPVQIAQVIRDAEADLVVLQEVSRGWAIGGGLDLAGYLSRELDRAYYWAPAADGQFGNLLLAPHGLRIEAETVRLPFGQGPMWRSYLKIRVDGGLTIAATHLTHKKTNTPTRLDQIDHIVRERPDIVVGDLNFWPTWDERRAFTGAGYVSAQDELGQGAGFTSPTDRPSNRVDWVFGTSAVTFTDFGILSHTRASDHFPILVEFSHPRSTTSL